MKESIKKWIQSIVGQLTEAPPAPPPLLREGWFEEMLSGSGFLRRYPHFAGVLAKMDPVGTNTVDTMAVALRRLDDPRSRIQLLVNVDYFKRYPEFVPGILLHETQHVLLGHLTNQDFHRVRYPKLMELAMEVSANEYMTEPVPNPGIRISHFKKFGMAPGQSTMERYKLLADAFDCGDLRIQDWWYSRMLDTHRPRQRGACRGGGLGDLIDARSDRSSERNWNRPGFLLGHPSSEAEIRSMKESITRHLRGARGGSDDLLRGSQRRIAKELERVVFDSGEEGRLDWRRVLREAFPHRQLIRPNYLRPNRRFTSRVGEIPGRTRRPPKPALVVGIDTSGSITGAILDRMVQEVKRLALHARLTIVECDAAVHRVYPLSGRLGPFIGGGDTDFSPVFEEIAGRQEYEGIVYFTDGKGDFPDIPPALPTLWVLTNDDPFLVEWGAVVRIGIRESD